MNQLENTNPSRVIVVAEHGRGRLNPLTWEMLTCGREVARAYDLDLLLLVLGQGAREMADRAAQYSGEDVLALKIPGLDLFHGQAQGLILEQALPGLNPALIIGAHNTSGMEWAPGLAVGLETAFVSGVEEIGAGQGGLWVKRTCLHGKLVEQLELRAESAVITVQPGAFEPAPATRGKPGRVEVAALELPPCQTRVENLPDRVKPNAALAQAEVVIAAGRGLGGKDNLALLRGLAALFSNAALAGSRPVCDSVWLGYGSQVGQTWASVAPKLYFACGISGALQHLAGMRSSGFIVALNIDPAAPIFKACDVGVVDDLTEFIPALIST